MCLEIIKYILGNLPEKRHFSRNPLQRYNKFLKLQDFSRKNNRFAQQREDFSKSSVLVQGSFFG